MSTTLLSAQKRKESLLGSCLVLLAIIFWKGLLLKILWNWFVITTIHSAPRLNWAHAAGLAVVILAFSTRARKISKEERPSLYEQIGALFLVVALDSVMLLAGLVIHRLFI